MKQAHRSGWLDPEDGDNVTGKREILSIQKWRQQVTDPASHWGTVKGHLNWGAGREPEGIMQIITKLLGETTAEQEMCMWISEASINGFTTFIRRNFN